MVKHDGLIYIVYRAIQKALFIGLGLSELKGLFGLGRGMCSTECYSGKSPTALSLYSFSRVAL